MQLPDGPNKHKLQGYDDFMKEQGVPVKPAPSSQQPRKGETLIDFVARILGPMESRV